MGAGSKTVAVLRELRDSSSSLAAPPPPAPKPVVIQIPPPDSVEQGKILEEVREYALAYTKQLPNFLCVQVTRRYVDSSGGANWYQIDMITTQLSYLEGTKNYKVVLVNNQPVNNVTMEKLGGTVTAGEFGSMMADIFQPDVQAQFDWERWATLRGKRNYVFSYVVDQPHSHYHMLADNTIGDCARYSGFDLRRSRYEDDFPHHAIALRYSGVISDSGCEYGARLRSAEDRRQRLYGAVESGDRLASPPTGDEERY